MKRIISIAFTVIIAVLFAASACGCEGSNNSVLTVGRVDIPEEEYRTVMSSFRNEAVMYYSENYGETDFSDSFWNKKYSSKEKTPLEFLREKACEKLRENHAILKWAKDEKIIPDDSYNYILEALKAENAARADKYADNQTVYGVTGFTAESYYDYVISSCSVKLRNITADELSDGEIGDFYERNKEDMFCRPYKFECKQIFIEGYDGSAELRDSAQKIMSEIENGTDPESAAAGEKLTVTDEEYDMSLIRTLSIRFPAITDALGSMKEGEVRLIEEAPNAYILKAVSKSEKAYMPLEEVKENVKTYAALEKFDLAVEKIMKETKYSKNNRNLKKIMPTD